MHSQPRLLLRKFCSLIFLSIFVSIAWVLALAHELASGRTGSLHGCLSEVQKVYAEAIDRVR